MATEHTAQDEERLRGAKGSLVEAAVLVTSAISQGACALSASNKEDAIMLAEGALVMLRRTNMRI